jgi:hypothetical protein
MLFKSNGFIVVGYLFQIILCFIPELLLFFKEYICGIVDVWRDNHVLIFYAFIYYRYAECTDELQLDDLQIGG